MIQFTWDCYIANLYKENKNFKLADQGYSKALHIYRSLSRDNPHAYLPALAMILNNVAILKKAEDELIEAEVVFREAIQIRRSLVKVNAQVYLPALANTINNIASVYTGLKKKGQAEKAFREALDILKSLAWSNPQKYLPEVARTALNLGIFFIKETSNKHQSLTYTEEALRSALPFVKFLPSAEKCASTALKLVEAWGEDPNAFLQKIRDQLDQPNNPQP